MGGSRAIPWSGLLSLAVLSGGCLQPPAEAEARLAEVKAGGVGLSKVMDGVEARLLGGQSTVALWRELAGRHQAVSAFACRNQNGHQANILVLRQKQLDKARKLNSRFLAKRPPERGGIGGPVPSRLRR